MTDLTPPFKVRLHKTEPIILAKTSAAAPPVVYDYGYDALVVSYSHKRRGKKGVWDGGGPFLQFTESFKHGTARLPVNAFNTKYSWMSRFEGSRLTVPSGMKNQSLYPVLTAPPTQGALSALVPWGSKGWHAAKPGKPTVDLMVGAAELFREGIPSIPGNLLRRLRSFRSSGSEYLNWNFGWRPLLSDIQKMYETYRNLNRQLDQLVRDNGKGIRRRRDLSNTTNTTNVTERTTTTTSGVWYPAMAMPGYEGPCRVQTFTKETEKIWFVGRFRYYIPDIGSDQWTRRATRALFGLNPTPEVLWNLLPWSWLIDWFTNVGDVVANLSDHAAENLTADYAYVMRTKGTSTYSVASLEFPGTTPTHESAGWNHIPGGSISAMTVKSQTEKARLPATPYGFGLTYDGLSPYQMSILAALAISRSRF
jgi:hypothetical protein